MVSPYVMPGLKYRGKVTLNIISIDKIVSIICRYFEMDKEQLYKHEPTTANVINAKHWCMYFICRETPVTLMEIGMHFDKDHTTVIYAREKIKGQLVAKHDNEYKKHFPVLIELITQK